MVVHVYSCLFTGIILFQIHSGILTWNGTGIFMNIHSQVYSCSWNFRKVGFGQIYQLFHKILSINIILKSIKGHVEKFGKIMCISD